jgi:adenylate kinase family enzyme
VKRVNVKGTSGSGKTTFAAEVARRLGVPCVELDALHHGPNWSEPTDEEFRARVQAAMDAAPDGWVIDGNYESKLRDLVLSSADTIVWLDFPFRVKAGRLWRRTALRIRDDVELWSGNKETWRGVLWGRDALFWWMVQGHFRHRREWPRRFAGDERFVRLRSVEAARRWLETAKPLASRPRAGDDRGMADDDHRREGRRGTKPLGEYLVELAENPERLEKHIRNPERAMQEAGVGRNDRDLVLSGDVARIREAILEQLGEDSPVAMIIYTGNWPINWPVIIY